MHLPTRPDLTLNLPTVRQLIQKGLSQFRLDSIRRRIPAFAIMGPTDDGGNSSVGGEVDPNLGNQFLQRWIPRITKSTAYRSGTVAIFITFDEPEDFKVIPPKQPVALVVIAPSVKSGTKSTTMFTHYSMLKTTEELLGITTFLGHAGDSTTMDLRAAFNL